MGLGSNITKVKDENNKDSHDIGFNRHIRRCFFYSIRSSGSVVFELSIYLKYTKYLLQQQYVYNVQAYMSLNTGNQECNIIQFHNSLELQYGFCHFITPTSQLSDLLRFLMQLICTKEQCFIVTSKQMLAERYFHTRSSDQACAVRRPAVERLTQPAWEPIDSRDILPPSKRWKTLKILSCCQNISKKVSERTFPFQSAKHMRHLQPRTYRGLTWCYLNATGLCIHQRLAL